MQKACNQLLNDLETGLFLSSSSFLSLPIHSLAEGSKDHISKNSPLQIFSFTALDKWILLDMFQLNSVIWLIDMWYWNLRTDH